MSQRIAIVTGSQQGIGLAIVRGLCKQLGDNGVVYLTALNEGRRQAAVAALQKEGLSPRSCMLDVNSIDSIHCLRDSILTEHGGLDILVNNAGIAYRDDSIPMSVQAEGSVKTNFFGVLYMTNSFLPFIRSGGRIVHVGSRAGLGAFNKLREDLQQRFRDVSTEQGLSDLMNEFVECTKRGDHMDNGWPNWAYGTSKLGLITLARIQAQEICKDTAREDILVNSCHPGYVNTDMTSHHTAERAKGRISVDEGADTPLYLSLLPPGTKGIQGSFLSKRKVYDFFSERIDAASL